MTREQSWDRQSNKTERAWVLMCLMGDRRAGSLCCSNCRPASLATPAPLHRTWVALALLRTPPPPRPAGDHPLHPCTCLGHKRLLRALSKRRDVGEFSPFVQISIHIFFLHWFYRGLKLLRFQGLCYPASPAPPSRGARRRLGLLGTPSAGFLYPALGAWSRQL